MIGTTAPDRKFRINNSSAESDEVLSLYRAASSNTTGGRSAISLAFVGAGYSQSGSSYGWTLGGNNDTLGKIVVTPKSYTEIPGNNSLGINSAVSFYVANSAGGGLTEKMTLYGNGNVGTGTPSPANDLSVAGTANGPRSTTMHRIRRSVKGRAAPIVGIGQALATLLSKRGTQHPSQGMPEGAASETAEQRARQVDACDRPSPLAEEQDDLEREGRHRREAAEHARHEKHAQRQCVRRE
jgi:hypothetical protein